MQERKMKRKKIQIRKGNRKDSKICEQLREELKEGEGVKRGRQKKWGERERDDINTMSSDVLLIGQAPMLHKQVHTQLQHV